MAFDSFGKSESVDMSHWSLGTAVGVDGAWKVGIYFFKVDIGSRSARLSASRNGAAPRPWSAERNRPKMIEAAAYAE